MTQKTMVDPMKVRERQDFYTKLKTNPVTRASFSIIGAILFSVLLFVIAIRPTIVIIQSLRTNISDLEDAQARLNDNISSLNSIVPEYRDLESRLQLVNLALPESAQFPDLERQVRYLIQKNNIKLLSGDWTGFPVVGAPEDILLDQETATDIISTLGGQAQIMLISVNLEVEGPYPAIKSFARDFQRLLRITTIDSISITVNNQEEADIVTMTMTGNVYYFRLLEAGE
jgi:Tfp pilus assembly protein PilO